MYHLIFRYCGETNTCTSPPSFGSLFNGQHVYLCLYHGTQPDLRPTAPTFSIAGALISHD